MELLSVSCVSSLLMETLANLKNVAFAASI